MPLIDIVYDEHYFRGSATGVTAPGGYDNYRWNSYFSQPSDVLASGFVQRALNGGIDLTGRKALVVGCAYGFLVKYLIELGVDAYGMDISSFAVAQRPELSGKLLVGDMRLSASYEDAKTLAGLTKHNDKFDVIIDEDALSCLSDADAITACNLMRTYSQYEATHLVDTSPSLSEWYNFHTLADWKALIGTYPKEKWYARFTWSEV